MKKLSLSLIALVAALASTAAVLSPEQALIRSRQNMALPKAVNVTDRFDLIHTVKTLTDVPAVYVFSNPAADGYMILSANDVAIPVLGYSDSGTFDPDNIPASMSWWLDEYARRIDFATRHAYKAYSAQSTSSQSDRQAIAPMLQTSWDQVEPYNNLCPLEGVDRTYTGCVATSVAQVMKYWNYPDVGQGSISYTDSNLGKRLTLDFSKRAFDWDNMLNDYSGNYTDEQADAVACLMRAAAFSVKMSFSTSASSAYTLNVPNGMIKYFNYDGNTRYEVRSLYAPEVWDEMIYNNLKNVGPVIYGGSSMLGGGHSFVCDGYDGNGYYHFNWGWSGMSNGYFLLDALVPPNLGAGGGYGGGYNFSQDAVLGVQPPTGEPVEYHPYEIVQAGSLQGAIDGSLLTFSLGAEEAATWLNYNPVKLNVTFGAIFEPLNSPESPAVTAPVLNKTLALSAGYGTTSTFEAQIDLSAVDLADGVYNVTFATDIKENPDVRWIPVRPLFNYSNSITLTKSGDSYSVENYTPARLRIVDASVIGDIYYACMAKVSAVIANDSDVTLSMGLAPILYYSSEDYDEDQLYFLSGSEFITVEPHSQVTHTWITEFNALVTLISMSSAMPLKLSFFDETTYNYYTSDVYKDVVMKPNPGIPDISLSSITIPGAKAKLEIVDGHPFRSWVVNDKLNIPVEVTTTLSGTVPFAYTMLACLLSSSTEDDGSMAIYAYNGEPALINPGDAACKMSTILSYPYMEPDKLYYVVPAYLYGSSFIPIGNSLLGLRYDSDAGVDTVLADPAGDSDSSLPVYSLQGVNMGTNLDALPAGLYIRGGKKIIKR